jgi:hypothetical protein
MDSSAEAGQPKQNKNSPDADDPTLDSKWDCELLMLFSITLPIPKKVTRPSSLRGNLLLRFLDFYGWGRLPKSVDNRSRETEEEHRKVDTILMFCSSLRYETREDCRYDSKETNL